MRSCGTPTGSRNDCRSADDASAAKGGRSGGRGSADGYHCVCDTAADPIAHQECACVYLGGSRVSISSGQSHRARACLRDSDCPSSFRHSSRNQKVRGCDAIGDGERYVGLRNIHLESSCNSRRGSTRQGVDRCGTPDVLAENERAQSRIAAHAAIGGKRAASQGYRSAPALIAGICVVKGATIDVECRCLNACGVAKLV